MSDMSITETAKVLNVGRSWLYERVQRSEVPCQRYGRTIRFTSEQVEQIRAQFAQPVLSPRKLKLMGRAS